MAEIQHFVTPIKRKNVDLTNTVFDLYLKQGFEYDHTASIHENLLRLNSFKLKDMELDERLLCNCRLLSVQRQKKTNIFLYMGHEVDLSTCGPTPSNIMTSIAQQFAKRLTAIYDKDTEELFKLQR